MKIQSQPQAVFIQQANPIPSADGGVAQGSASQLPARFQDGFEQRPVTPNQAGIIDFVPPYPFPQVPDSLSQEDRLTSSKLPMALSNPLNKALLEAGTKDVVLSRDIMGTMRGPEGQPLAKVWLNDGTTAFVDPNTNRYYLTDEGETYGRTNAMGPLDLPEGSKFSNSYFTDPEVRGVEQLTQVWAPPPPGPMDPVPAPRNPGPLPPLPLPLPEPRNTGPLPPLPLPEPRNTGPLPPLPLPLPAPRIPEDWL